MTTIFRINLLAGVTVETLDSNGTWVVAMPGESDDLETREQAQEWIDGWDDAEQVDDVTW